MRTLLSFMVASIITTCTSLANAEQFSDILSQNDISLSLSAGVENFRGIPEYDGGNNYGVCVGFNIAGPVPYFCKYELGFQLGGSYAALDFAGRGWNSRHRTSIQSQEFLSMGLFLRPNPKMPLSAGIVYDWMFNQNYSVFGKNPTLQQLRGQFAYFVTNCDEVGVWGTYDIKKTSKTQNFSAFDFEIIYRPIAQASFFWRRLYGNGVESNIWVGSPIRNRLHRRGSNRPGKLIVGLELDVPFLEDWILIGKASYMQPGTKRGVSGEREYASNIVINLVYFFGGNPNTTESQAWIPYMPTADNSNFLADMATKTSNFRRAKY